GGRETQHMGEEVARLLATGRIRDVLADATLVLAGEHLVDALPGVDLRQGAGFGGQAGLRRAGNRRARRTQRCTSASLAASAENTVPAARFKARRAARERLSQPPSEPANHAMAPNTSSVARMKTAPSSTICAASGP